MRRICFTSLTVLLLASAPAYVAADIVFESSRLGPTGITWEEATVHGISELNVSPTLFNGVRFQLYTPVVTTQVGGHFVGQPNADPSFFGAIVRLDGSIDFPDSEDLSTSDVRGTTLLTFPDVSAEVFGELNLFLEPGWYALVFGSGLFNATGAGSAIRDNPTIGISNYIGLKTGHGWKKWQYQDDFRDGLRFMVLGNIVPEPATIVSITSATILVLGRRYRRKAAHGSTTLFAGGPRGTGALGGHPALLD